MQLRTSPLLKPSQVTNSSLSLVTPMVLTYNEEVNIDRVLTNLTWAERVLVIDSFSTDNTLDILKKYPNVHLVQRKFDSFAAQCNYGLGLISTDWVLSLDADYVLTSEFIAEVKRILDNPKHKAYQSEFKFCVFGKPLRSDNTTARTVLYRTEDAYYINTGHQHRIQLAHEVGNIKSKILHDDRKSLSRWLGAQDRYLKIEARLWLNGWRGWFYTMQRTLVEILLAIRMIETENQ